jgi:hypothetical protein
VGRRPRPLRGLLPLPDRPGQRPGRVDPRDDAGPRGRLAGRVRAVVHGHGPPGSGRGADRAQGVVPDRRAGGGVRPVPPAGRRQRADRPGHGGRLRRRRVGAALGPGAGGSRARAPAAAAGAHRQDRPRAAPPRPRGSGHAAHRRSRGRAGRRAWRPGPPVGLQARRALGLDPRQRPRLARRRAPARGLRRRRVGARAALRPRGRAEHAGRRALRRARLPVDLAAAGGAQRQPLRADELAFRGRRGQAPDRGRGRRPAPHARGRHLRRSRRGPGLLLQQRGGLDAHLRLGPHVPRALRLEPARHACRRRPRALGLELLVR